MRGLILGLVVQLLLPSLALAQITGRVLDRDGNPITFALVQLLSAEGTLATVRSNARGEFDLRPYPSATEVRAAQFAFEEVTVGLGDLSRPLEIVLPPKPFQLAEIRAVVPEASCPSVDLPQARDSWLNVLASFRDLSGEEGWGALILEWRHSDGFGTDFAPFRDVQYDLALQSGGPRANLRLWIQGDPGDLMLVRERSVGDSGIGPGIYWRFPSFEGPGVPFLLSPAFAQGATIGYGSDGIGLVICHTDDQGAAVRIAALLDDSGILTDLHWKLRTSEPVEEAGGHLGFVESSTELGLPLPRTSYFWHREMFGQNSQDYRVYSPWLLGRGRELTRNLTTLRESLIAGAIGG